MDFESALGAMRKGAKVRRPVWHANRKWVMLMTKGGFTEPFLVTDTNTPEDMEWPLSLGRSDWLAQDWMEIINEDS